MEYLPAIISALGTIIAAWFAYNQYSKNKLTDLKIEKFKKDEETKSIRRADNSSIVYGELWSVLHELDADRVYIVQPHPLGNESLLSVYYEVKRKGVEPMKPHMQGLPISEVPKFSSDLVKNLFLYITDIDEQVNDKYAKSILSSYGCRAAIIKRLNDNRHDRQHLLRVHPPAVRIGGECAGDHAHGGHEHPIPAARVSITYKSLQP